MKKIHKITLTEQQLKLIDHFLDELEDSQSNACCNDLPNELVEMFTEEEGKAIAEEYAKYNNPEEPEGPNWPLPDFCLVSWLRRKLKIQWKKTNEKI